MALAGCCGCFDLRRGSIAIGITLLVLYSILFAACLFNMAFEVTIYHRYVHMSQEHPPAMYNISVHGEDGRENWTSPSGNLSANGSFSDPSSPRTYNTSVHFVDPYEPDSTALMYVSSRTWRNADVGIGVVHLALNIILVLGVKRDCTSMILAWLVYHVIAQLAHTGLFLAMFVGGCLIGLPGLIGVATVLLAVTAVLWYWFVVVLHFYRSLSQPPAQDGLPLGKVRQGD